MAQGNRKSDTEQEALTQTQVPAERIYPNPWNVNEMDQEMFQKELNSIAEFGFVDPLLVRAHPWETDAWQIIDGEHRWRAGLELGMTMFPVNIIEVDDETAQELSIVLNETRGTANTTKLASLVRSLAEKRDPVKLQKLLPFSRERFTEMVADKDEEIDFDLLRQRRDILNKHRDRGWVERVYRLPADSADVVDQALKGIMDREEITEDWRALELMSADSLAGE